MNVRARRSGGWILVEAVISVILLGGLLGAIYTVQLGAWRVNHQEMARRRCIVAAQSMLESATAEGAWIGRDNRRRLWPELRFELSETPGEGDWTGLTLFRATAIGKSGGREVRVTLSRYAPAAASKEESP